MLGDGKINVNNFFYELGRGLMIFVGSFFRPYKIDLKQNKFKDEDTSAALIVGNHVSFSDPFAYMPAFRRRKLFFVASELVMDTKLKNFLLYHGGCIKLNRNIYDIEAIRYATEVLKFGHSLMIFPEGTLHHDNADDLSEIKSGAILLAVQAGVPIIPVYSRKREHWYSKRVIVVGDKFDIKDYTTKRFPTVREMDLIADALVGKINECKDVFDSYMSK